MCKLFVLYIFFIALASVAPAQTAAPVPVATATLPKDRAHAWQMLQAATGLAGDTLQPWSMRGRYKTYDAYGKPKAEGTFDYVWAGQNQSRESYSQGSSVWTRWTTKQGVFVANGEAKELAYPESLILTEILDPLHTRLGSLKDLRPYKTDERFGPENLTCFRTDPLVATEYDEGPLAPPVSHRFCTLLNKPFLLFSQGSYDVFFGQDIAFQNRIVAQSIKVRDGSDWVIEIDVELVRMPPAAEQLSSLVPPPNAVLVEELQPNGTIVYPKLHVIKRVYPKYPEEMKAKRVQGIVRLGITVHQDGTVTMRDVLHSPAPELTLATVSAIKQWVYAPPLRNGKPAEIDTEADINFTMAR